MIRFLVYTLKCSYDRTEPMYARDGSVRMRTCNTVLAWSRTEAVEKCLPVIKKELEGITDESIKFVSVYVGRKAGTTEKADRLAPLQISVESKTIRERL